MVRTLVCTSLVLASLAPFALSPTPAHAAWFNSSYLFKKPITIDHTKVGRPQFDAVSAVQDKLNQASPLAWNHTVGTGSNTLLIVTIAYAAAKATTGVTFNAVAMTQITGSPMACSASCNAEMWYLKNPASGTHSVSVTFPAGTVSMVAGSSSYQDVNQTTPIGTVATASNTAANMSNADATTVGNQLIVDGFAANANTFTVNAAQTLNYESHTNAHGGSSYRVSAGASTTMTWANTSTVWVEIIAPINPADLTNFPVLIKDTADANLKTAGNGGSVQNASGFDMIFTDSTETTKLDHEIEKYVPTTGEIEMWVRIPTLSAAVDTVIYLYYDNASISTSQENKTGVWDSSYNGVWHLKEMAGNQNDSTSKGNNLTSFTGLAAQGTATGVSGGANQTTFNTLGNARAADSATLRPGGSLTVETWVKYTAAPSAVNAGTMIYKDGTQQSYLLFQDIAPVAFGFQWENTSSTLYGIDGVTAPVSGTWYHVVGIYDSTNNALHIYVNGVRDDQSVVATTGTMYVTGPTMFYAGGETASATPSTILDEPRLSNTVRSGGWIATEYNDQSSPSTFLTFGAAVAGAVSGTQTFTASINPGVLTVVAPANVTSPNLSPGTTAAAVSLGALSYTDTLNDATAWSVTLAATDLGAGTIPFSRFTIGVCTSGNIVSAGGAVGAPTAGAASQTLAGADGVPGTTFSTPITLATAATTVEGSYSTPAGATGNTITIVVPGTATGAGLTSTLQYTVTG